MNTLGSSPLARGLLTIPGAYEPAVRIIPARAGFTEKAVRPAGRVEGSSPLARGLPGGRRQPLAQEGIIPARAGFTPSAMALRRAREDHPRSRGVYANPGGLPSAAGGSSPLARGLQGKVSPAGMVRGIIPARAGFTDHPPDRNRGRPDHPRSRGVYGTVPRAGGSVDGSSPLARGLRQDASAHRLDLRIIPARAGFTCMLTFDCACVRDHPRSRGVYVSAAKRQPGRVGSSPLARGLRQAGHGPGPRPRIIPARAGFTLPPPWRRRAGRDHPRSRGVYLILRPRVRLRPGSSPLARGLRHSLCRS